MSSWSPTCGTKSELIAYWESSKEMQAKTLTLQNPASRHSIL